MLTLKNIFYTVDKRTKLWIGSTKKPIEREERISW